MVTLLDTALTPFDFAQSGQACPVSPRVIWTKLTVQNDQAEVRVRPSPVSWIQWMLSQYACACTGFPAIVHVVLNLMVIFPYRILVFCGYLQSFRSVQ